MKMKQHRVEWVSEPDEKLAPTVEAKHRTGVPALTKIAAKWHEREQMACPHAAFSTSLSKRAMTSAKVQM